MLDGQVALVTGASRGIGRAIAVALLERGAAVAGTATTAAGAERIQAELAGPDRRVLGLQLDVTEQASIDDRLAAIADGLGGAPSILVNNAGITRDGLLMRMPEADWDAIIATNLTAVYRVTKACLRPMTKARQGRIINIASVVGAIGNAGQANYAAAKAGMIGFTKSLAREVGSRGVTANCVAPGFIDTDMTKALTDAQRDALLASIPLKRLGAASEIGSAVAFLASNDAAYITGETIHVNGGMYMA